MEYFSIIFKIGGIFTMRMKFNRRFIRRIITKIKSCFNFYWTPPFYNMYYDILIFRQHKKNKKIIYIMDNHLSRYSHLLRLFLYKAFSSVLWTLLRLSMFSLSYIIIAYLLKNVKEKFQKRFHKSKN